MILDNGY